MQDEINRWFLVNTLQFEIDDVESKKNMQLVYTANIDSTHNNVVEEQKSEV